MICQAHSCFLHGCSRRRLIFRQQRMKMFCSVCQQRLLRKAADSTKPEGSRSSLTPPDRRLLEQKGAGIYLLPASQNLRQVFPHLRRAVQTDAPGVVDDAGGGQQGRGPSQGGHNAWKIGGIKDGGENRQRRGGATCTVTSYLRAPCTSGLPEPPC